MTYAEYSKLVQETIKTRDAANMNVCGLAKAISDKMVIHKDFSPEMCRKIDILYAELGKAIEMAKTASAIADYYVNDDCCIDVVLDRVEIKDVDIDELLDEEKEDEYI